MAMQAAKTTNAEAVRDALSAADFETFYSRIKFTPQGDGDEILMGGMIGQVQKGGLATVFPEEARSAAPVYPQPDWDKKA
jgi:branched-chain amino acid transport system substrate-binding protein